MFERASEDEEGFSSGLIKGMHGFSALVPSEKMVLLSKSLAQQ